MDATSGSPAPRPALVTAGELFGGVEKFILTYADHLKHRLGIDPLIVLYRTGPLHDALRAARLAPELVRARGRYDLSAVGRTASLFRERGVEVVHTHGYVGTIVGALAARRAGRPVVKTEHGAPESFRGWPGLRMKANLAIDGWVSRHMVREVVYVTDDLRRLLPAGRTPGRVIHNALAPLERSDYARPPELEAGAIHLGIVGRLVPVKGHVLLFEALARLGPPDSARLVVLGDGPLEAGLRQEAARLGIEKAVRFVGFRTNAMDYMAHLDMLVLASSHEGLPYTVLEAMHLGVPIVSTAVGGPAEVLRDGETGLLVPPGDPAALASALERAIADASLRRRLGENARVEARRSYSLDGMARKYLDVYRSVLAGG